jgi:hypothetical protein
MASSKSLLDSDRFTFHLYKCTLPKGELFYARFYERDGTTVLADRSTGEADERRATAAAGKLLSTLPLAKLARAKAAKSSDGFKDAEKSDYIRDRVDAEKPLSNCYI